MLILNSLGPERKPGWGGGEKSNVGSRREPRLLHGHPDVEVSGVTRPQSRLRCAGSAVTCSTLRVCSDSQVGSAPAAARGEHSLHQDNGKQLHSRARSLALNPRVSAEPALFNIFANYLEKIKTC